MKPSRTRSEHWVIALDELWHAPAEFYARQRGKRILLARSFDEVNRILKTSSEPRSILFAAERYRFNQVGLERLRDCVARAGKNVSWGGLVASDTAGASFIVAKMLAMRRKRPHLVADPIHGRSLLYGPDGTAPRSRHRQNHFASLMSQDYDVSILHCHGEGSHANFHDFVLCGLVDSHDGRVLKSLRSSCSSEFCRRVHDSRIQTMAAYHYRSAHCFLMSCSGFSTASEAYPSDQSLIVSFNEGYVSHCISAARYFAYDPDLVSRLMPQLASGSSLGDLVRWLDRHAGMRDALPAFVLHGDPETRPFHPANARGVAAKKRPPARRKRAPDLLQTETTRYASLLRRCAWLSQWECAVRTALTSAAGKRADVSRLVRGIGEARAELQAWVHGYGTSLRLGQRHGSLPDSDSRRFWAAYRRIRSAWMTQVSDLISREPFGCDEFELMRDFCLVASTEYEREKCERCSSRLIRTTYASEIAPQYLRIDRECPVCGPSRNFSEDRPELGARFLCSAVAGGTSTLRLITNGKSGGIVLGRVTDKTVGRTVATFRRAIASTSWATLARIALPKKMGEDLHTVRLMFVTDFDVSVARLRFILGG